MTKSRSYLLAEVIEGEPNAETRIERLRTFDGADHSGATSGVVTADVVTDDGGAPAPRAVPAGAALRQDPPAARAHGFAGTRHRQ